MYAFPEFERPRGQRSACVILEAICLGGTVVREQVGRPRGDSADHARVGVVADVGAQGRRGHGALQGQEVRAQAGDVRGSHGGSGQSSLQWVEMSAICPSITAEQEISAEKGGSKLTVALVLPI